MHIRCAALQYQFGANFAENAGDTTYTFDPDSGESFVDGVNQSDLIRGNHIFRTIWDGDGVDTYDLSNYTDDLQIDLNPGEFSTFSAAQVTQLGSLDGVGQFAAGNVANAYLYNGDTRSLIENATGGVGNDTITGNQADNRLEGGIGRDQLSGGIGNDILVGDGAGLRTAELINLVRLNEQFDAATQGGGYNDHSLDQPESFAMPTTALTMEMLIRLDSSPSSFDTIFAYSSGDEWSTQDFTLRGTNDGTNYSLFIAGQEFRAIFSRDTFTLDEPVRLSISWDSSIGDTNVYLDGSLVANSTIAVEETLTADGNFWLFSGWDATIHGAVGDIRVFDHVRSAAQIDADAWVSYDDPANVSGLVANWQADSANAAGLTELTGNASDLKFQNVTAQNPISFENNDFSRSFDDLLDGGAGADVLDGGTGNDTLDGGEGADTLDGGEGVDTASYAGDASGVNVNLASGVASSGSAVGDTLISIENIIGTDFVDNLAGDTGNNGIEGGEGNDNIFGRTGNDTLDGGIGNDTLVPPGNFGGMGSTAAIATSTMSRLLPRVQRPWRSLCFQWSRLYAFSRSGDARLGLITFYEDGVFPGQAKPACLQAARQSRGAGL